MASASVNLHLHADDEPFIAALDSGSVAIWLEAKHKGPTVCGRPDAILKLRDAIDAYLAQSALTAEAA